MNYSRHALSDPAPGASMPSRKDRWKANIPTRYHNVTPPWSGEYPLGFPDAKTVEGYVLNLPENDKARRHVLDGIIVEAMELAGSNVAADRGTHTHLTTELQDEGAHWLTIAERGEDLGLPTELQAATVAAWLELLERFGLEILDAEITVANSIAAGTLDRTARLTRDLEFHRHDGSRVLIAENTVVVLDIKTGQIRTDPKDRWQYAVGYSYQIGHYANARPVHIDPDDPKGNVWGQWAEGRRPSGEHALIAHLDVKGALETGVVDARMIYVDLTHYDGMTETIDSVRYWRKSYPFSAVGAADVVVPVPVTRIQTERLDWLQARINLIGMTDARRLLVKHWPAGVAPPSKNPEMTLETFTELVELVDRVEDEASMPFGEPAPGATVHELRRR